MTICRGSVGSNRPGFSGLSILRFRLPALSVADVGVMVSSSRATSSQRSGSQGGIASGQWLFGVTRRLAIEGQERVRKRHACRVRSEQGDDDRCEWFAQRRDRLSGSVAVGQWGSVAVDRDRDSRASRWRDAC